MIFKSIFTIFWKLLTFLTHLVDTSAAGLLVPEGIICPVVSTSALTWFISYTFHRVLKGVGLGYGRQLYFHFLLKYMVICAFENPPSIPSFLATQIVYIRLGSLKKNDSFSFYLFITLLLVFLYLIASNKSVLLLYACAHKISLKYLFPEKMAIEICC